MNLNSLVVDVSRYQPKIKPAELKAGGVELTILKCSGSLQTDNAFSQHYEDCQAEGMDTAVYHWVDPIYQPSKQVDVLLKAIAGKNISAIFLDLEQWWNNWGTWYDALRKKIEWSLVPRIRPDLLAIHAYQTLEDLIRRTDIPVGIYTSYGFVTTYAPKMAEWLGLFNLWVANWTIKSAKTFTCSWETLKTSYMPTNSKPLLPPGADLRKVIGWQYTGDLIMLPGMYADTACSRLSPADVSVFDGDWLRQTTGKSRTPVVLPEPTKEKYTVSAWVWRGLNFREKPGTNSKAIKTLRAGAVLTFTGEKIGDWMQVENEGLTGWVHSAYITKF